MKIPKYIRELYAPTMRQWMRWLRFRQRVKGMTFDALHAYFTACSKGMEVGRHVSCGLHSTSSRRSLPIFPWASFDMSDSFQGTMLSVTMETHDSDLRDIVCADNF